MTNKYLLHEKLTFTLPDISFDKTLSTDWRFNCIKHPIRTIIIRY